MVLFISCILTLLFIGLSLQTKNLHRLEVAILWMFTSNIIYDVFSMGGVNLGHITTSDNMEQFSTFVVVGAALIPAFITWMLGIAVSLRPFVSEYAFFTMGPFILVVVEYMSDFAGIIDHYAMSKWASLILWFFVLLAVYLFHRFLLHVLKGV